MGLVCLKAPIPKYDFPFWVGFNAPLSSTNVKVLIFTIKPILPLSVKEEVGEVVEEQAERKEEEKVNQKRKYMGKPDVGQGI